MAEETPNPEEKVEKTPTDILIETVELAEEIEDILIIYYKKDGTYSSKDNGLCYADVIFLLESYKHWIMRTIFPSPAEGK